MKKGYPRTLLILIKQKVLGAVARDRDRLEVLKSGSDRSDRSLYVTSSDS